MENNDNLDNKTPERYEDTLRRMSYSELKSEAKSRGLKLKNIKTEKLIARLISCVSDDLSSFTTPEQQKINSSRKNKEDVFDQDVETPLQTPHRATYSIETPSDSVLFDKLPDVTQPITSEKKPDSAIDECNITILRGSERKLRPRKVSFMSPKKVTPRNSPKYMSLKDRPKTPIASRKVSFSTPLKKGVKKSPDAKSPGTILQTSVSKNSTKSVQNRVATPSAVKRSASKENAKNARKRTATPSASKRSASKENIKSAHKRIATPNFKKIHEKAFDKMESIDDYQKRKLNYSAKKLVVKKPTKPIAKTKIPVLFGGIPFIPSVTSCADMKITFASQMPKSFQTSKKDLMQTTQQKVSGVVKTVGQQQSASSVKDKSKFDLQASLSKKLRYKPYTGPLKPLTESNCADVPVPVCHHSVKEPVKKPIVQEKRQEARKQLKGVRTNRRFELQMKSRNLLN